MALDFPTGPTDGQTYVGGGVTWTYSAADGAWQGGVSAAAAPDKAIQFNSSGALAGSVKLQYTGTQLLLDTTVGLGWGLTGYLAGISSISLGTLEVNNGTKGQRGRLNLDQLYADHEVVGGSLVSNGDISANGTLYVVGNAGVGGATPKDWGGGIKEVAVGPVSYFRGDSTTVEMGCNIFYNNSGQWIYRANGAGINVTGTTYGGNAVFSVNMVPNGVGGATATPVSKFTVDWLGNVSLSGNMGVGGAAIKPWAAGQIAIDIGPQGHLRNGSGTTEIGQNLYYDGAWKYRVAGSAAIAYVNNNSTSSPYFAVSLAPNGAAGATALPFTNFTVNPVGAYLQYGPVTPTLSFDTTQAAGTQHALSFTNNSVLRWQIRDSTQTFAFANFDDSGTYLGDSLQLDRTLRYVYVLGQFFLPRTDNSTYMGSGSARFSAVYAVTGTIQTSDARMKKDVQDSALGLSFIESLHPVSYKWIVERNIAEPTGDGSDVDAPMKVTPIPGFTTHYGLIAQEVKLAVSAAGTTFGGLDEKADDPDAPLGLNYSEFIAPLVKAVQELSARVKSLEAQLAARK